MNNQPLRSEYALLLDISISYIVVIRYKQRKSIKSSSPNSFKWKQGSRNILNRLEIKAKHVVYIIDYLLQDKVSIYMIAIEVAC